MSAWTPLLIGAAIGGVFGAGMTLCVFNSPWTRRINPATRIDPYLRRDRSHQRRGELTQSRWALVAHRLLGPVAERSLSLLERLTGGEHQLRRRLRLAGRGEEIDAFRVEQVIAGTLGFALALVVAIAGVTVRGMSPMLALFLVLLGVLGGVMGRDYLLTRSIAQRAQRMAREFPTVADILALAVGAGESPVAAMERVATSSKGVLPEELGKTVAHIRSGVSVSQALVDLAERSPYDALGRFSEGIAVAIERGTPLADVLRAQAQDARESSKRDLMEVAGKREIAMLVPVVFFVLPLVILFALFPGLAVLQLSL